MDERLRGRERYLDEIEPPPTPKWRLVVGALVCLIPLALVVLGGKLLLFPELSIADFAFRSLIGGVGVALLWVAFFRRRFGRKA